MFLNESPLPRASLPFKFKEYTARMHGGLVEFPVSETTTEPIPIQEGPEKSCEGWTRLPPDHVEEKPVVESSTENS